ncbi:Phosphatidylinositolglycan class N-domain-containing protein [Chytriomyces cf. hyalinus JEL632]|nr:Phosphatidylinositolglycan class N-domain-containing protein [Chytriomyces cf. hyalinus JEL632]
MADPKPRSSNRLARLLVLGVLFHVVYSWSIFDIYFRSPLVHGMTPVEAPQPAPASRLVLFVADGLRADKLFEKQLDRAPFLKDIVMNTGSFGISRTHVPTESRPGHVALIAGFYEDVSAVTKGWKHNPVEFDSVFNESRKTWSFGSPDILPMFADGASDKHRVETFMYPPEFEDFAEKDASMLDTWVFDKVDEFFEHAQKNETTLDLLRSDKIVFFLHLLGLDTNGHAHRPYSKEYLNNIQLVDSGIKRFVENWDAFFNHDGKTAYVFTADHGMSNRGNHGDGNPDNTETPLIAWGAGIAGPDRKNAVVDSYSIDWGLDKLQRVDVNQADVAPLMSTLIGIPYPMNSVGELPLAYLNNSAHYKAEAAFRNARQILRQFFVKQESKRSTELYFEPFPFLLNHETLIQEIQGLIDKDLVNAAIEKSQELAKLCIEGLRYYQIYDWLFLRGMISVGYLGWIANSLLFVFKNYAGYSFGAIEEDERDRRMVTYGAVVFFAAFSAFMYMKQSHSNYYLYIAFLVYLWAQVFKERRFAWTLVTSNLKSGAWMMNFSKGALYFIGLEILVYSYFSREILTPALIVAGIVWPMLTPESFQKNNAGIVWYWRISCIGTSIFLMLPVEFDEDMRLVTLGGILILVSGIFAAYFLPLYAQAKLPASKSRSKSLNEDKAPPAVIMLQLLVIFLSIVIVNDTSSRLKAKKGLPLLNQVASWLILASCAAIPMMDSVKEGQHYLRRLVVIYLSFAPVFILLSISYEALFYFCFSQTLLSWLLMERQLYSETSEPLGNDYADVTKRVTRSSSKAASNASNSYDASFRFLTTNDLRTATIFLFLINVAFFGTGNIASVASFTIDSVYRFFTVFNPFLMAALVIVKMWVPFFLLSAVFGVVSRSIRLPAFSLFLLVLSTTDVMTLNFFFLVRDDGSWLEIGTTISHFIIASSFIVFQIVLFSVGHFLVGRVLIPEVRVKKD